MTDILSPTPENIQRAAEVLKQGGLVAFPTETVYGLGAHAYNDYAVQKIFLAKGRPATDPLIAHIHDLAQLAELAVDIPAIAYDLAEHFWAGALTLVLHKSKRVAPSATSGLGTVAVRMPNHPIALALIQALNAPICAPSANLFTKPSPTTAAHVWEDLNGRIDLILEGGQAQIGVESTIVDLTTEKPIILRAGAISIESLREVLPTVSYTPRYIIDDKTALPAPGSLLKHYSPRAAVYLYLGDEAAVLKRIHADYEAYTINGKRVGIMGLADSLTHFKTEVKVDLGSTSIEAAQRLFAALRWFDHQGTDIILVWGFSAQRLGEAVFDRLYRAAEGKVIHLEG